MRGGDQCADSDSALSSTGSGSPSRPSKSPWLSTTGTSTTVCSPLSKPSADLDEVAGLELAGDLDVGRRLGEVDQRARAISTGSNSAAVDVAALGRAELGDVAGSVVALLETTR